MRLFGLVVCKSLERFGGAAVVVVMESPAGQAATAASRRRRMVSTKDSTRVRMWIGPSGRLRLGR